MSGEDKVIVLLESLIAEMRAGKSDTDQQLTDIKRAIFGLSEEFRRHRDNAIAQIDRIGARVRKLEHERIPPQNPAPVTKAASK